MVLEILFMLSYFHLHISRCRCCPGLSAYRPDSSQQQCSAGLARPRGHLPWFPFHTSMH